MQTAMNEVIQGDCLEVMRGMADKSVHCCVTSPPYFGLRDYGVDGQLGLEKTPDEYVSRMVEVFREVRRVLRDDGTLWLNLGDSYASSGVYNADAFADMGARLHAKGHRYSATSSGGKGRAPTPEGLKTKDLIGIPWRVAFALQADGWYLRQDIIWHKPNPMPESVRDRCTKAHEYLFLLSKSERYYFDSEAMREQAVSNPSDKRRGDGGNYKTIQNIYGATHCGVSEDGKRNRRSIWTVATRPYKGAHFATFPPQLIEPCILAGCPVGGTVLDPFFGSGTTGSVAVQHGRQYLGIELNPEYIALAQKRIGEAMEKAPSTLEQRVAWLETQVQAQGAKLRKIEANQQLSLFG